MPSPTRAERVALLILFVLGAWLRFQHSGAIEYNIDQGYPIWQAIQTLDRGVLPLAGQGTSVLFANPPLTGYFLVPVLALVRQPLAAYAVTMTLNTFAIWLAYRGLRWLVGTRPALVGAALVACNPWIIEDSRRTWVQSLAPFFVCLIFWALAPLLTGQTRHAPRRTLVALVGLALFAHTYLLAYALVAPVMLLTALFWQRIPKRQLAIGAAVFAVLLTLYAVGLARQWDDTRQRAQEFSSGHARLSDEALSHALRLVTGWEYAAARGADTPAHDADLRENLSDIAHGLWTAALLIGLGRAILVVARRIPASAHERSAALILLAWFALPVLMMSYVSRVVHPFYLLLTLPAGHGLAAWGIAPLLNRRRLAPLAAGVVIFTLGINGLNAVRFAQNTAAHPGEDLPETLPLAQATALGNRIRAERHGGAVFSQMDEWTPVTLGGEVFRVEQIAHADRALLIPPEGALVILSERDPNAPISPPLLAHPAGPPLVLRDGARIALWHVSPQDVESAHPAALPSDIDVSFAGWSLGGDLATGQTVTLDLTWRIDALHPERGIWTFAPYAHLFDGGGARVLIAEGEIVSALTWAAGDLLVQRLTLAVPEDAAGPFSVKVGLYDSVRGVNAIFRIPAGDETTFAADIPIIPPQ